MTATMVGVDWGMLALGINNTPRNARETVVRAEGLTERYGEHAAVTNVPVKVRRDDTFGALQPINSVNSIMIGLVPSLVESVNLFGYSAEPRTDGQAHAATLIDPPASDQRLSLHDDLKALVHLRPGASTPYSDHPPVITSLIDCGGMCCIMSGEFQLDRSTHLLRAAEVA